MATDLLVKLLWVSLLLQRSAGVFAVEEFLPPQRNTELGCFREREVVSYTCTVVDSGGNGLTVWTGTVFDCPDESPRDTISLFNMEFSANPGARDECTNGAIVGQSVGVDGDEYTSVLTINVSRSFDGQTVSCGLLGGTTVGSDTLQVGVVPGPPVNSACSFPVPGETFTVLWSPPPGGVVGGAEYSVTTTGDCGSCTTNGLMTSCSGWTARGQSCIFTAQTTTSDCGLTSRMSEPETIVLRVPPRPSVTRIPAYSTTGLLLRIRTEITESQFSNPAEVCGGVFGAVTHFLLEYTSSSGTICSSRQLPAGCDDGVCVDVFNVTSDCRGVSYNTSVRAGNIVGLGAASTTMFESNSVCDHLELPANGNVTFESLSPGSLASYSCNRGYVLVGKETLLCQTDVQWSGEPPVCNCTVPMLPLETVNKGKRIFIGCFRAEYSVQTGYCPSTFIATFNNFTSQWEYPSTSVCTGAVVGITFVLTFISSLALGIIIGVISVLLWNKFRRKQPPDSDIKLRDTPPAAAAIYEEPEVMKKEPKDIETSGNIAYGPVHTRR